MLPASLIGALNGVLGDHLVRTGNPLAIEHGFYRDGDSCELLSERSLSPYPDWRGSVCLFLHGAAASEEHWSANGIPAYPERLYENHRLLPALIRYNSGRHISENGRLIAALLEAQLNDPRISDVVVVGHSMGGLVFRSACHYARMNGHRWTELVRKAFYLGSPHLGAPLEKFGAWTEAVLNRIKTPYTQAAARVIGLRSSGIRDLRHGYLTDEEWQADSRRDLPVHSKLPTGSIHHLDSAQHYLIAGTAHNDPYSLTAKWFGDIMVRKSSALADCPEGRFGLPVPREHILLVGGHHHVNLMRSEPVYKFISKSLQD